MREEADEEHERRVDRQARVAVGSVMPFVRRSPDGIGRDRRRSESAGSCPAAAPRPGTSVSKRGLTATKRSARLKLRNMRPPLARIDIGSSWPTDVSFTTIFRRSSLASATTSSDFVENPCRWTMSASALEGERRDRQPGRRQPSRRPAPRADGHPLHPHAVDLIVGRQRRVERGRQDGKRARRRRTHGSARGIEGPRRSFPDSTRR